MSAIVYTGMRRYSKARSKAIGRYRRKAFLVWYCILALGSFFVLNWKQRILSQQWDHTYVFFKHEDEGIGPKLAAQFLELGDGES